MYSFWNSSISIPTLITNDMVLSKLQDGADLFAPGISSSSVANLPDDLPEGTIIGIGTLSVKNAIRGIGRLSTNSSNLKKNPQGKAVDVLHVEGDQLWALGDKSIAQPKETSEIVNGSTSGTSEEQEEVSAMNASSGNVGETSEQSASLVESAELTTAGKRFTASAKLYKTGNTDTILTIIRR